MHVTRNTTKTEKFEDLRVWQKARELTRGIYTASEYWKDFGLRDQIRRASVSIVSNIAEGYERETREELIRFLYIARGSCGEVRAQLYIASDLKMLKQADYNILHDMADYVIRMLAKLISTTKERKYVNRVHV